jgi:CRP-like cAMP-binding protein
MITLENLIGRIGNVPHFKGMPETALKEIVYAGQILNYPADSILFTEGGPASGLYVIFKGQIHLYRLGVQGQEVIIATVNPVVMFNECTAIDGNPNPVTAVATQVCVVWRVPANRFQSLVERYPQVGTGLLRMMAQRNRQLLARYEDLFSLPVLGRTAKILLDLSQWGQVSINRYNHSNQKMAALAATVPEAVSRSIKKFKEMDILDSDRTQITIIAPDRLANMTNIGSFWYDS